MSNNIHKLTPQQNVPYQPLQTEQKEELETKKEKESEEQVTNSAQAVLQTQSEEAAPSTPAPLSSKHAVVVLTLWLASLTSSLAYLLARIYNCFARCFPKTPPTTAKENVDLKPPVDLTTLEGRQHLQALLPKDVNLIGEEAKETLKQDLYRDNKKSNIDDYDFAIFKENELFNYTDEHISVKAGDFILPQQLRKDLNRSVYQIKTGDNQVTTYDPQTVQTDSAEAYKAQREWLQAVSKEFDFKTENPDHSFAKFGFFHSQGIFAPISVNTFNVFYNSHKIITGGDLAPVQIKVENNHVMSQMNTLFTLREESRVPREFGYFVSTLTRSIPKEVFQTGKEINWSQAKYSATYSKVFATRKEAEAYICKLNNEFIPQPPPITEHSRFPGQTRMELGTEKYSTEAPYPSKEQLKKELGDSGIRATTSQPIVFAQKNAKNDETNYIMTPITLKKGLTESYAFCKVSQTIRSGETKGDATIEYSKIFSSKEERDRAIANEEKLLQEEIQRTSTRQ